MSIRADELEQLPLSERLQLVEDLWEGIAAELETPPLPESLRAEMDARLAAYLADPSTSLSLEEAQRRMKAGD
jgi:putative addiction module component (TIGR02574 family)